MQKGLKIFLPYFPEASSVREKYFLSLTCYSLFLKVFPIFNSKSPSVIDTISYILISLFLLFKMYGNLLSIIA